MDTEATIDSYECKAGNVQIHSDAPGRGKESAAGGEQKTRVPAMTHEQYHQHLRNYLEHYEDDAAFQKNLNRFYKEASIIAELNLDNAIPILMDLYCPTGQGGPKDAVCMLRSMLLMTLLKEPSITNWVSRTRSNALLAVLAGFAPDNTPGVGTYYDFINKIIDGPYHKRLEGQVRRSEYNAKKHHRHLKKESDDKKAQKEAGQTASRKLVDQLIAEADHPRKDDYTKILEDLLLTVGLLPTIEGGFLDNLQNLTVTGDGSILESAASADGKPTCNCRKEGLGKCDHPKSYTSPTAQWCFDAAHGVYKFGDRYYHLIITQNGRDFPIHTLMPGGNISDHTLSLESFDRFLKIIQEHSLNMNIGVFCGDGHHDTNAHYDYFLNKGVIPVIPLSERSKKAFPHLTDDSPVRLDEDGVPLCPGGCRMRRHQYNKQRKMHVYVCPAKRPCRINGQYTYDYKEELCPLSQNCKPESSLGPIVSIRSTDNPRFFPPIPRNSQRYKEIMNLRSGSERVNAVNDSYGLEGTSRNADRGLVRLIFANIVQHAVIRYNETSKAQSFPDPTQKRGAG